MHRMLSVAKFVKATKHARTLDGTVHNVAVRESGPYIPCTAAYNDVNMPMADSDGYTLSVVYTDDQVDCLDCIANWFHGESP